MLEVGTAGMSLRGEVCCQSKHRTGLEQGFLMHGRPEGRVSRFSKRSHWRYQQTRGPSLAYQPFCPRVFQTGLAVGDEEGTCASEMTEVCFEQRGSCLIVYPSQLFRLVACENAGTPRRKQGRLCTVELLLPGFSGVPHRSLGMQVQIPNPMI